MIKEFIPLVQHATIIGDKRKYLTVLLTLKLDQDTNGDSTILLSKESVALLKALGSKSTTSTDIEDDKILYNYIRDGIDLVNARAISNVHKVKKWAILPSIFTVKGGELTPTLKVKRNYVEHKYKNYIDKLYK